MEDGSRLMTKQYRVTVIPALEHSTNEFNSPTVSSIKEAIAASEAMALLLIHMANYHIIPDYSNMFIIEEYIDGEWLEIDDGEEE